MRTADLLRGPSEDAGTFGRFTLDDGWSCFSGELPWRNNMHGKSCIPPGVYTCALMDSPNHGIVYHVLSVPDRSDVEIHSANFTGDVSLGLKCELLGCIALGLGVGQMYGQKALLESRAAIVALRSRLNGERFQLTIYPYEEPPKRNAE